MSQVLERQVTQVAAFEAFGRTPGFGAGPVRGMRETAFARFVARGFPTTRDEEWKFTNVAPIAALPFEPAAAADPDGAALEPFLFEDTMAAQILVVNGRLASGRPLGAGLPPGVTVRRLSDLLAEPAAGAMVSRLEQRPALAADAPFADLNTAFFEDGVVIEIAPKAVVADPIHVLFASVAAATPVMVSPRLMVIVGERAEASVIETYMTVGAGDVLTNAVTQIAVEPGAVLKHAKLQREAASTCHMASTHVDLGRTATFTSCAITLGGRISRNDIVSTLNGDGAECTLDGLYVATGDALVDTHTAIDHAAPHCPSHEVYKGILAGRARAVFNGKIVVRQIAQKTDAKQTNKALLLTNDAQVNTKPQLEIFADDVKCTHGAAIGQLDEDAMFYLRARGISEADARNMLIHAFAGDVLDRLAVPAVRERAMRVIEEILSLG
jgi:Fe-S cluster assembly protein SufD